jgi:hypothetical protein
VQRPFFQFIYHVTAQRRRRRNRDVRGEEDRVFGQLSTCLLDNGGFFELMERRRGRQGPLQSEVNIRNNLVLLKRAAPPNTTTTAKTITTTTAVPIGH